MDFPLCLRSLSNHTLPRLNLLSSPMSLILDHRKNERHILKKELGNYNERDVYLYKELQ